MESSLAWLREYVDIPIPADELAHRLTMAGLESVIRPRYQDRIEGVIAARILSVEAHPNADRLSLCLVDTGAEEVKVVCGAPNVRPGLIAPLALPKARIAGGQKVKKAAIRGVESFGMLLAEDELGVSEDHSGIMELDGKTKAGLNIDQFVDFDDHILEVDLTPNRGDCACLIGLAREVAALLGSELRLPQVGYPEEGRPVDELAQVTILDPDLCPRYAASLMGGMSAGPSPWWLRDRLLSAGQRPINNLVDVTNYVMLEMNQPLHAFDFDHLAGGEIRVRRATAGEPFVTLDGADHRLEEGMCLICDAEKPVALAGVMGGLNSEVEPSTSRVLLEAAYFDPTSNRRTATRLGFDTEASYRFQRGIDPKGVDQALRRATGLMADLAGGKVHPGLLDENPLPFEAPRLTLRTRRLNAYLGTDLSTAEIAGHLNSIEIEADAADGQVKATVPSWRPDLVREVDLIEEVARLYGYDLIPTTFPPATAVAAAKPPLVALAEKVRSLLTGAGLFEAVTYVFLPADAPAQMGWPTDDPRSRQAPLLNPLSEDQSALRSTLLWGLGTALAKNLRNGAESVRLFEWGNVFTPQGEGEQPAEECRLAALLMGSREPLGPNSSPEGVGFADLKGVAEHLLAGLGVDDAVFEPDERPGCAPGRTATVKVGPRRLGWLGQLNQASLAPFRIKGEVYFFDLSAEELLRLIERPTPLFSPLPRFPHITRDIDLVVGEALTSAEILDSAAKIADPLIAGVLIFDCYQSDEMRRKREKSIGLRVRYQSPERTLTEEEITPLHERLTTHLLESTGGGLRQ